MRHKIKFIKIINEHYKGICTKEDIYAMSEIMKTIMKNRGITIEELGDRLGIGYIRTAELTGLLEADDLIITDLLQRCSINPKLL